MRGPSQRKPFGTPEARLASYLRYTDVHRHQYTMVKAARTIFGRRIERRLRLAWKTAEATMEDTRKDGAMLE